MRGKSLVDALFSTNRQRVLAATLMHPNRWWFLADLARHIGVTPSTIQREVRSLAQVGILVSRKEGKQVYFRPNPHCPILSELQGIMAKTTGLLDVLKDAIAPFFGSINLAFVYGSLARSEELADSDVDLMIVGRVGLADLSPALRQAEDRLARPVNPTLYSPEEFSMKVKEGHSFLNGVLGGDKLFIVGNDHDVAAASGK